MGRTVATNCPLAVPKQGNGTNPTISADGPPSFKCKCSEVSVLYLPVPGVELVPVGHHSRLAVVEERREVDPVVPVLREVPDLAVRQHGLHRRKVISI